MSGPTGNYAEPSVENDELIDPDDGEFSAAPKDVLSFLECIRMIDTKSWLTFTRLQRT